MMKIRKLFKVVKQANVIAVIIILALLYSSCGKNTTEPTTSEPPEPTHIPTATDIPLADLTIKSIDMEIRNGEICEDLLSRMEVIIEVLNQGQAKTGPFAVKVNDRSHYVIGGLDTGETIQLRLPGVNEHTIILVDSSDIVPESYEDNNQITQQFVIPTLPANCLIELTPAAEIMNPFATLDGHDGKVWCVRFSPSGNILASGSVDNTLRLWLVEETILLRTMYGHPFPITSLDFSPDGANIATGSSDGLIRIWRISDGRLIKTLVGHAGWINDLEYSPDGKRLASVAEDFTVRIWRVNDGKLMYIIDEGMSMIHGLSFSPDSSMIAWAENNGMIRIWHVNDKKWINNLSGQVAAYSVSFSPDGNMLAAGYRDGIVRLWQITDSEVTAQLHGHGDSVSALAFSPDGKWLVSGSHDSTLQLWQVISDDVDYPVKRLVMQAHDGPVNSVSFSPDGKLIASGSDDATIMLWSVPEN